MFDLAIEIANMKQEECSEKSIQNLFARHGIWASEDGYERGFEPYWWNNDGNEKGVYALFFDSQIAHDHIIYTTSKKIEKEQKIKRALAPGEQGFDGSLWRVVSEVQAEIRNLFNEFISGYPCPEKIKKLFKDLSLKVRYIDNPEDKWSPVIELEGDHKSVKNLILSREIIFPFYRGEGHLFQRIRRCPECGNYFFAKDVRKTYCSEKCRNTMNNKNRI